MKPGHPKVPITAKTLVNNGISTSKALAPITSIPQLELFIDKQKEIDGVGMGVLSDGTAFLTGRGLSRLCGISNARVVELGQNWDAADSTHAMTNGVKKILQHKGISIERPYIEIKQKGGTFNAYPDVVCLAVLEYYAFDLPTDEAKKNFRILAGKALHDFIYTQVGYDPNNLIPEPWRQFHDRMSLVYNAVPTGYFGIFKEISDMIIHLGQAGLHIDSKFVPDVSIGVTWGKNWTENELGDKYGERIKFEHNYPHYFPQSTSNPQDAWCYPEMALGAFRKWIRNVYVGQGKFEKYLSDKVKQKALPASFAQLAVAAYAANEPTSLPHH